MTERSKHRFKLQAIHPEYACPAFETMFETNRLDELRALLGPDAANDRDFQMIYWLESSDLAAISTQFGLAFDAAGLDVVLFKVDEGNEVPYLVHTGYELALMIDGRKKFAHMYHEYPPSRHRYEERFDHFVTSGLLHKEVDLEPFDEPVRNWRGDIFEGVRHAYYTLKGEEWRIEAYRLIKRAASKTGWNDTLERLEGMLFGYDDRQNDWWVERLHARRHRFGSLLIYAAVAPSELAAIEFSGFRTLPPLHRSITMLSALEDDLTDEERRQVLSDVEQGRLIRFNVKARPFLDLVQLPQGRVHRIHPEQIRNVNGFIVDKIEVV